MPTILIATQTLEQLKLRVKHLSEYLEEVEISSDGYIDDPDLNSIVDDISDLHHKITP